MTLIRGGRGKKKTYSRNEGSKERKILLLFTIRESGRGKKGRKLGQSLQERRRREKRR